MNAVTWLLILIGIFFTSKATASTSHSKNFIKIGHRGACGYEPENTLRSFQKAIDLKVDAIELDVHCCKGGELVVIHDSTLNRTTNGDGYVRDKTLQELKTLNAGKGETIPTLAEVLDLVNRKVIINIELKGPKTAQPVANLITEFVTKSGWSWDDFFVSSFNHHELKTFAQACPYVKIGALTSSILLKQAQFASKLNAYAIIISSECINQTYIDRAHARGLKVYVYTVNEIKDIAYIKAFGVDGIFSNFPDRL